MVLPFDTVRTCPKCLSGNVRVRYDQALGALSLMCGCGYSWNTNTADYQEKPSAERSAPKKRK